MSRRARAPPKKSNTDKEPKKAKPEKDPFTTTKIEWTSPTLKYLRLTEKEDDIVLGMISDSDPWSFDKFTKLQSAETDFLSFRHDSPICNGTQSQFISSIINSIQFKKLHARMRCDLHCTERFVSGLINKANLTNAQVSITLRGNEKDDFTDLRESLLKLPKFGKFTLEWDIVNSSSNSLIDDDVLFHIASNVSHAELLGKSNCTAEGILGAFEIVCDSSSNKHVKFQALTSYLTPIFSDPRFEVKDGNVVDRARNAIIYVTSHESGYSTVWMCKNRMVQK